MFWNFGKLSRNCHLTHSTCGFADCVRRPAQVSWTSHRISMTSGRPDVVNNWLWGWSGHSSCTGQTTARRQGTLWGSGVWLQNVVLKIVKAILIEYLILIQYLMYRLRLASFPAGRIYNTGDANPWAGRAAWTRVGRRMVYWRANGLWLGILQVSWSSINSVHFVLL